MNLEEICPIANPHGVNLDRIIKIELIRALQTDEGNFDCFASGYSGICDQADCFWREDCLAATRQN